MPDSSQLRFFTPSGRRGWPHAGPACGVHTGILGALFALSNAPYYATYAQRARHSGIDAAADQQIAGLVMWVPAGMVLTVCGLALVLAWLAEAERRSAQSAAGLGRTSA